MKKLPAQTALNLLDSQFEGEGKPLKRLDLKDRTKAQFFEVKSTKRQLALVVGDLRPDGKWKPQQTRILVEEAPVDLTDVEPLPLHDYFEGGIAKRAFSRLAPPRQRSVLVASETGLRNLLSWYTKPLLPATSGAEASKSNAGEPRPDACFHSDAEGEVELVERGLDTEKSTTSRGLTEEDLLAQLARNAEVGRLGELKVFELECERVRSFGCVDPERYVLRHFETDVGRGYDLETTWPGAERCIEVKSTSRAGSDLFLTPKECDVLENLGERAWLYRMVVAGDEVTLSGEPVQDPIPKLRTAGMVAALWRVADPTAMDE